MKKCTKPYGHGDGSMRMPRFPDPKLDMDPDPAKRMADRADAKKRIFEAARGGGAEGAKKSAASYVGTFIREEDGRRDLVRIFRERDVEMGETPLMAAARNGNKEFIKWAFEEGLRPDGFAGWGALIEKAGDNETRALIRNGINNWSSREIMPYSSYLMPRPGNNGHKGNSE